MFILEILLGLKSMQGDVTRAFLHADLEEKETVYIDMPMGFAQYGKNGKKTCLKLKKTPDGLQQSPRAFWRYITVKLVLELYLKGTYVTYPYLEFCCARVLSHIRYTQYLITTIRHM
jgi:hypothetical protein